MLNRHAVVFQATVRFCHDHRTKKGCTVSTVIPGDQGTRVASRPRALVLGLVMVAAGAKLLGMLYVPIPAAYAENIWLSLLMNVTCGLTIGVGALFSIVAAINHRVTWATYLMMWALLAVSQLCSGFIFALYLGSR
jgi:hypothetical protein